MCKRSLTLSTQHHWVMSLLWWRTWNVRNLFYHFVSLPSSLYFLFMFNTVYTASHHWVMSCQPPFQYFLFAFKHFLSGIRLFSFIARRMAKKSVTKSALGSNIACFGMVWTWSFKSPAGCLLTPTTGEPVGLKYTSTTHLSKDEHTCHSKQEHSYNSKYEARVIYASCYSRNS